MSAAVDGRPGPRSGIERKERSEADPVLTMSSLRIEITKIMDKHKANPRLIAADPLPLVCEQSHCYLVRNGPVQLRDSAHISNVNAIRYMAC